jgi:hypothetical protein
MAYWPWPEGAANLRELHLARMSDRAGDQIVDTIYIEGELIDNLAWSSDSQHFIFQMGDPGQQAQLYLGHICQQPTPLLENAGGGIATWVEPSLNTTPLIAYEPDSSQQKTQSNPIEQDKPLHG